MALEDDTCDTCLVLGLGSLKFIPLKSEPASANPKPFEPSLALGISEAWTKERSPTRQSSSPKSAVSASSGAKRDNVDTVSGGEEDGSTRKKLRLTKEQSAFLEDKFREHSTLSPKQKHALAKQLKLQPRQVEVWFQNRRARTKLKQTEVDCEVLRRWCETLSHENRRLQKELQELKALESTPPQMYTHLPATTLKICASCESVDRTSEDTSNGDPSVDVKPKHQITNHFARSAKPKHQTRFLRDQPPGQF